MTVLVLMGVSGCGKTTVAKLVAEAHGVPYQEGDALHPPENVAKMSEGHPLTDEDRWPWLHAIAAVIDGWRAAGQSGLVTCSALKRAYRDILIGPRQDVRLVFLRGDQALIAGRLAKRRGHYMPSSLLDSQFATLEEPGPDESPFVVDIRATPEELARQVGALL
ncbi:MAG TPA: gluconokinase [Acetobacteraceae bacterium]|nr:gluconokinase [Acetobacteraceae bacterium]